ncbi:MAG: bifunctional riboflavin kinase/FAD synthetase [Gammaproteobacteria bacterium]|nr:bifunctional riboflavin kinase/FAD synthetase [Gammaproteobacteria bacterium]
MEIIRGLHNVHTRHQDSVCSIGNFDGVHVGHVTLLRNVQHEAVSRKVGSLVITFEPQPREYFQGKLVPARLTRFREKVELIREIGIKYLLCLPFDEKLQTTTPDCLIEKYLVETLNIQHIVVGKDFRFGKDASGSVQTLRTAAEKNRFTITQIEPCEYAGATISSTRVRDSLQNGDFNTTESLLGRQYFMMGPVVLGNRFGGNIGIPTANIRLQRYRSPLEGIFAVRVEGLENDYYGAAYVGTRPTIGGTEPLLEVHILNLHREIYGKQLKVCFLKKIRSDEKFDSIDSLKVQMDIDITTIKNWLKLRLQKEF